MKTIKKPILMLILLMSIVSCSENNTGLTATEPTSANLVARADNSINVATLPQTILDYIAANYPNETIVASEIEDNGNYEVNLSNNVELIFDANGTFLGIDDDSNDNYGDSYINPADLPQVILDYVATNYPNNFIDEAELENNGNYEVELNDDTVLIFDADGNFLGIGADEDDMDNDDGDDDGDGDNDDDQVINPATLPQIVLDYISTNYPNDTIMQAKIESDGEYEVTLSSGIELHFDANGNFLNTDDGDDDNDGQGD